MLQELRIRNIAIIDELSLSFSKGLNILTGETGTGKSIILGAVQLLLGSRATEEMIRDAREEAVVEALFDLTDNKVSRGKVKELFPRGGMGEEESALVLKRTLSRSGRGKTYVNGNLATLGMFSEIGAELLSVCGQHEHQSLQRVETHVDIVDEFGGLMELRGEFERQFAAFTELAEDIRRIREEQDRWRKERELMAFQAREIELSSLQPGEEEALKEEQRVLVHARKLVEFVRGSEEALDGEDGSAIDKIRAVVVQGREMAGIDRSLLPLLKTLESSLIQLEEVTRAFTEYEKRIELDPERLEGVESRLDEINRLKKKYGPTVEAVLSFKKEIDEKVASFAFDEGRLVELESRQKSLAEKVGVLERKLSEERKRVSIELKKSIEKELASLGMKKTTFRVEREEVARFSKGIDRIEFLISPNPGEEVKPLAKIASGGELSRMMLAMKRIMARGGAMRGAESGGGQVLIFDEVDSGIGGAIAEVVGKKLKDLSREHQVICVTHLPQIACFGDTHYSVRKGARGGRTVTQVDSLNREGVIDEVARMLGGLEITEKTRSHAKEMIDNAQRS